MDKRDTGEGGFGPFEKRKEKRFAVTSTILPFLGTRQGDHASFQYLLLDISRTGARIAIPSWVVSRERLKKGDLINFNLPFKLSSSISAVARILWSEWDADTSSQVCGAGFDPEIRVNFPVYLSLGLNDAGLDLQGFSPGKDILGQLVKDAVYLKKGITVYLGHLLPYFSRVTGYSPEEYPLLRESYLNDVREKAVSHYRQLEHLFKRLHQSPVSATEIPKMIDLEELRSSMESEINVEILNIAFETKAHQPYVVAIKQLEERLYLDYNTIVMLYLKSLA